MQQSLYNYILVLLLPLCFVSCSSNKLNKFGKYEYFKVKKLDLKSDVQVHKSYWTVGYVASKENHCFDTVDEREVYTVGLNDLDRAINHFYFKTVSYNAKVVTKDGHRYIEANAVNETDINLEVAHCTFDRITLFRNFESSYASFRLKR